jgi:hypothetical protein
MVSLSLETSFLSSFGPDSGSEVRSKMLKATMTTRRNRTYLKNQQEEQQTDCSRGFLGRKPLALFYD